MRLAEYLLLTCILAAVTSSVCDEYPCPKGAYVHLTSLRCYWTSTLSSSWPKAQEACWQTSGGDLARVKSSEDQSFILSSFASGASEWIWVDDGGSRDVAGMESHPQRERSAGGQQQLCAQMALGSVGQWRNATCGEEYRFLCEKEVPVSLPSVDTLLTGIPLMSRVYTMTKVPVLPAPPDVGHQQVKMMLFPGLWFSHAGKVLSVQLVKKPGDQLTHAKVQILRPYCRPSLHLVPPGCSSLHNPFSCCSPLALCNTTGGCAAGQYWCHIQETCLPATSPCSPYSSPPGGPKYPLPPRYPAAMPLYHLVADLPLSLPPSSEPALISVVLPEREISVYPDDILALQHTGPVGSFLECSSSPGSPWQQSYVSLLGPEWGGWVEGGLSSVPAQEEWFDGVVCDLRVLYADTLNSFAVSPMLSTDQSDPSGYTHAGTSSTPLRSTQASNAMQEESDDLGLTIVHPALNVDGEINLAVNIPTLIVIKILSGSNATSTWSAPVSQSGLPFEPHCPPALLVPHGSCEKDAANTRFSYASVLLSTPGSCVLNISALTPVSSQSVSLKLNAHEPVTGLRIQPGGDRRMLVDVSQMFQAMVDRGSSVKYTWVIDNLVQFAYEGQTYSVVFKKSAEYKLNVTAQNPVSSQSVVVKLSAEMMRPLTDPSFHSVKEVIAVNTDQLFTFRVKVDISVGTTFRWDFGDNSPGANHSFPPPSESQDAQMPQSVRQIFLQDSISHTYKQPGDYRMTVRVFSKYERVEKTLLLKVRSLLAGLRISTSPPVPLVNQTFDLEALPWPSPYGILYKWNLGDNSKEIMGFDRKVSHVPKSTGVYNVTVSADNTLSVLTAWVLVEIVEKISGVQLSYNGPSEFGSTTTVEGVVSAGTNLHWTFDMGDGSLFTNLSDGFISYLYKSPGNYSVRVTVENPVSQAVQHLRVEVYKLTVFGILPSGCLKSGEEASLKSLVNGVVSQLTFHWNFGDGTPVAVRKGISEVGHIYSSPGQYKVNVTVLSSVGSSFYLSFICIEATITSLTLDSTEEVVEAGQEICFNASVHPKTIQSHGVQFLWYNSSHNTSPATGPAHFCFVFEKVGTHQISVQARNNISNKTAYTAILVQEPVADLTIKYKGDNGACIINDACLFWVEFSLGTNFTVLWDFGEGSPRVEGQNLSHIFTSVGRYDVSAAALNAVSQVSVTLEVTVLAPMSGLTLKVQQPLSEAGNETVITAHANDMRNVSFYWSVYPSIPPQLGTSTFTYVFLKAGTYRICATAQNAVSKQEAIIVLEVLERIRRLQIASKSILSERFIPTRENVSLTAVVMSGSNLTYQWLINQNGTNSIACKEEHCQLFTDAPGDIMVEVMVSNALGNMSCSLLLRAVEHVSGVTVSTSRDTVPIGKPVKILVSVETGTDLQYIWYVGPTLSPTSSDVPSLLHVFTSLGHFGIRVSVRNVLSSSEATKEITVQEEVHEVNFRINSKINPFFVSSGSALLLSGSAEKGSDVSWEWKCTLQKSTSDILGRQQSFMYSFMDAGVYRVSLNASNDVSWQTVSHRVIVQDAIQGLKLNASSLTVCANEPIVFTPKILKGSNISFSLQFSHAKFPVNLIQNTYTKSDLSEGNHTVTARAWNQVSSSSVALNVLVVERVQGLQLINCCSFYLESIKKIYFQAQVLRGSAVTFSWIFHLMGLQPSKATGQNVSYTPPRNGSLTVSVEASNGVCSQSLTKTMTVQRPVKLVKLVSDSTEFFVNYSVTFSALTDNGNNLKFKWEFGDSGTRTLNPESQTVSHLYLSPGKYVVQVTAFNSVSKASARLPIEVRQLECAAPRLSLVQSQAIILRSRPSYFEARVDLQGCTAYKTSYRWEVCRAPGCGEDDRLPVANVASETTPLLMLPRLMLPVGFYCINLSVGLQGTPLSQHQSVNIRVVHSQLVPVIKGGSHRLWSSHKDLLMDGRESHDPDDMGREGEPMQYHWNYVIQSANLTRPLSPPTSRNGSVFILSHTILQPGAVYVFTLTVQKAGRAPVSTTQSVTIHWEQVLAVSVACVTCSSSLPVHYSHRRPLALSGRCPSCSGNSQYRWSALGSNDEVLELNEITTSTGASSPDLVVRTGVLLDGLNYTFTLNVSQPVLGLWGTASITLLPYQPPHGGVCTLTPDTDIHLLETVVTYNCSGWVGGDGGPSQLRYTLQVEVCPDSGQPCHLLTLYKGIQPSFGTLVPLGSPGLEGDLSVITVVVLVEDDLGTTVTALNQTLAVLLPVDQEVKGWLKNKSQSELWPLVQRGNPQEVVPYSIAMASYLNQVDSEDEEDLQGRMVIRENLTRTLTSLPVSTLQDAAQISSALALCTAVPRELACEGCQDAVLTALERMISVIGEQTEPGDVTALETGRNILQMLGSSLAMAAKPVTTPGAKARPGFLGGSAAALSAYGQAGELMRSLMRSRLRGEEAVTLTAPLIRVSGRRSDPTDLLCTDHSSPCQFHIPRGLGARLRQGGDEVVQILLGIDGDGPHLPPAHPPISTSLAAMEFTTPQGRPIPVTDLPPDRAIRVRLPARFPSEAVAIGNLTLPAHGSVNFTVGAVETDLQAGLFLSFNFSLHPGTGRESQGQVIIVVDNQLGHSISQYAVIRELNLSLSTESPAVEDTIFLSPLLNSSAQELYVNVTSVLHGGRVQAALCVFSYVCQYFNLEQQHWSSEGLRPLGGSSPRTAHCLTQHLTLFGASLFVHPDALILLPPPEGPVRNVVAGIVCTVLLLIHLLLALISHKLDHLDSTHSSLVPLCGRPGRYQYRVLVKTGWARGSGTTAHVGISLYGLNKSGSRHLQREAAFQRNALDHFQVETDASLGEIWKVRIWHDNTGLSPAWFLQHVVVWDQQTDYMYFFLVEEWLSVENERNGGMVEKEVLASCPRDLRQFSRVFRSQLVFGMFERHLWASVWERSSRSNFTRVQRVTCCALLLHLYLAAGAVWYGAAGTQGTSGPVSASLLMNAGTVAVGMTTAVLVFPLSLLFCFLFRMTACSKVTVDESELPSTASQTVEMDVYLSHSEQASSYFLSLPGESDSILDGVSHSSESLGSKHIDLALWTASKQGIDSRLDQWPSCDSIFDLPELQGAPPLGPARLLKRKKALLQLSLASPACSLDEPSTLTTPNQEPTPGLQHNSLTLSEEDLIQSIASGAAADSSSASGRVTSDSGRYSPWETAMSDSQESSCSGWSELSREEPPYRTELYKRPSTLSVFTTTSTFLPSPSPDIMGSSSTTRIGVARSGPGWLLPSWVLGVTYLLIGLLLGACLALVGLYASSFTSSVLLMWLVSSGSAFLTSALFLEPLKVCIQALLLATLGRPVDPEVEERLRREVVVRRDGGDLGEKVRPPCGYGLLHAKEEARKIRTLRSLMKSCLVHMLFFLVVLLVNYQDSSQAKHGRLLYSAVKSSLLTAPPGKLSLSSLRQRAEAWQWMDRTLVPYLYQNPSLLLLGLPRIRRVQSQDGGNGNATESPGFRSDLFAPVFASSSHETSGERRGSAHSSCSGHLPSWLCQQPRQKEASGGSDTVNLGNSSEVTRQLLLRLQDKLWIHATTKAVYVDFTQHHRETALFVAVTVSLDWSHAGEVLTAVSIEPFHVSPSQSGPDLQVAMMVLLVVFALSFLGSELWAMVREGGQGQRHGCQYFQLLVSLLSLASAVLQISFFYKAASCLSHHGSQPQTFTDFHSAALLARLSSQLSALLLTLLALKTVGVLRFVRRWAVFGRVLLQAWRDLFAVFLVLMLMLLFFSHTGSMLFSSSVEGFRTVGQASLTLVSALRGRAVTHRLCETHPMLGPLFCLSAVASGLWVLGRLCGAMLMRSYQAAQAVMYRPAMEPQDYEMVEFFIKRLKLWMGLSRTKEFRHKVKFEGMASPPSRSSLGSRLSSLSDRSPDGPRLSSAQSLGSVDSCLSDSHDVQFFLDRLLPTLNSMLSQFDRVNQLTDDLHCIELKLQEAQTRIAQKWKQPKTRRAWKISASTSPLCASPYSSPLPPRPPSPPHLPSLPSFLSCNPTIPCTRSIFSESRLPWCSPHPRKATHPAAAVTSLPVRSASGVDVVARRISGRRPWHSGSSHSADAAQRSPQAVCPAARARPWSEEGGRSMACDRVPLKRRAWHPEGPDIVG